jgi:6-phosphogluconolactonase
MIRHEDKGCKLHRNVGKKYYFSSLKDFNRIIADRIFEIGKQAISRNNRFMLALSGGNTPRPIYKMLATKKYDDLEWSKVHIFLTDERFVEDGHPDSNFGWISKILRGKACVDQIYPMWRSDISSEVAALQYEKGLRDIFNLNPGETPHFDLMLLGIGEDGHVASLFPDQYSNIPEKRLVYSYNVPKIDSERITLTLKTINNSIQLIFIVKGIEKSKVIRSIENGEGLKYPVSHIEYLKTQSEWIVHTTEG